MNRQDAIEEIRSNWETLLRGITTPAKMRVNGRQSYVCPICGHGSNGDGITINPKGKKRGALKCFGGSCDFSGDVIDLLQRVNGCDFNTALETAAAELGIQIDEYDPIQSAQRDFSDAARELRTRAKTAPEKPAEAAAGPEIADYTEYYKDCAKRTQEPAAADYLRARGISQTTAALFSIGYDPQWISPTAVKNLRAKGNEWTPPATARIIMPVSKNYYVARAIDPGVTQYKKQNETGGGSAGIFNSRALYAGGDAVFVVEGIFDALAVVEAGGTAIALNSTTQADKLIEILETRRTDATLIICLDNDNAGKQATEKIRKGLARINVSCIVADISCGCNDPNEALTQKPAAFADAIRAAEAQTAARPDNVSAYIDSIMAADIEKMKQAANRKTGFKELDEKSGGLYPGLYVIPATSSLGKTTFSLQLADNLAAAGHDVLFFSLEQSRLELVSKSFARILAQKDMGTAVSSLRLRKGLEPEKLREAAGIYKQTIGDRMSIIEGNFACNISFIGNYIRRYVQKNGGTPIIFIDYLQILQPADDQQKATVKETVDNTVTELKRISRELDLTVFVISSVNRANYLAPIDFESLKESGGIEYTADCIWGLQLRCISTDEIFEQQNKIKEKRQAIRKAKAANPRQIELLCLKNRYGIANYSCYFDYYPANDLYVENVAGEFAPYYGDDPFEAKDNKQKKAGTRR